MLNCIYLLFLAAATFIPASVAINQTFVIRGTSSVEATGNLITLQTKMPNTEGYNDIVESVSGSLHFFCVTGWWQIFEGANYTGFNELCYDYGEIPNCNDYGWTSYLYKSIRHLGPQDTSLETITLYSERRYGGQELILSGAATPNTQFHAQSLFVTGHSNWTFFERPNYEGFSICFESNANEEVVAEIDYDPWIISTIGSVIKGCEDVCTSWNKLTRVNSSNTSLRTTAVN